MGKSTASRDRVRARARDLAALELRKAGATYQVIADHLDISESGARNCVIRSLDRLERAATECAEETRSLELQRLDAMLLAIWGKATDGDLGAIQTALRLMERRAKLEGLDKPTKLAATDPTGEEPGFGLTLNEALQILGVSLGK